MRKRFQAILLATVVFSCGRTAPTPRSSIFDGDSTTDTPELWFSQLVDHGEGESGAQFKQRYYIDSSNAESAASPVFFYVCGEAACEKEEMIYSLTSQLAKAFKAHIISLEHRYYGKSMLFEKITGSNLRFLKIPQALEDIIRFKKEISRERGLTGKWISFGGSYAGILSAYLRSSYPNEFSAAFSSSAPIHVHFTFPEYDDHVGRVLGPDCAAKIRKVIDLTISEWNDPTKQPHIKQIMKLDTSRTVQDAAMDTRAVAAFAVQYGMQKDMCSSLVTQTNDDQLLASYSHYLDELLENLGPELAGYLRGTSIYEDDAQKFIHCGSRQWSYQVCTEFGMWDAPSSTAANATVPSIINNDYYTASCQGPFGIPANDHVEQFYNGMNEKIFHGEGKIFFSNGSEDPWSRAGITAAEAASNAKLVSVVIDGGSHCSDMGCQVQSDGSPIARARDLFNEKLASWLHDDR